MTQRKPVVWLVVISVAALVAGPSAAQLPEAAGDLRGTVRSLAGGEAGVWVIAENR